MTDYEFIFLLYDNVKLYIIDLLIFSIIFYAISRRYIINLLNPLLVGVIGTVFADTIPLFLFQLGKIDSSIFLYFVLCEISFWLFFMSFYHKNYFNRFGYHISNEHNISKLVFNIFFVFVLSGYLFVFATGGIGLFMENRFDVFADNTYLSLVVLIINLPKTYCIIYLYDRINVSRFKSIFLISLLCFLDLLTGTKSFILPLIGDYFIYKVFFKKQQIKIPLYVYPMILLLPTVTLLLNGMSRGFYSAIGDLSFRFVEYGDGYWMAFPNHVIANIKIENPIEYIFHPLLSLLHISPHVSRPPIGTLLMYEVRPEMDGILGGPNARCPITAYALFQYGGVLFSAICGYIASFIAFRINRFLPSGLIGVSIFGSYYSTALVLNADPFSQWQNLIILTAETFALLYILRMSGIKIIKNG